MKNNNKLILSFSDIRAKDLPLVGGKGANLGEMTYAGFPVPSGFCLTTVAFQQFMASSVKTEAIYDLLETVTTDDVESVRRVGQNVRQILLEVPIPDDIVKAVRQSWQKTGTEHAYAVRSSATAEDLPDASFAGQQDTYLNIIGETALLDAIRRCWVSLFTDRAILYRIQNNFSHQKVLLSVVVQQMIMSEKSGTLFTADPVTGHRKILTIDTSFGLGEALVSGLVTPDTYQVNKDKRAIINHQIADKKIAVFPKKEGGTRQENLNEHQQKQLVLTDEEILELADMGCQVELYYGTPQDIEWANVEGRFYLLQTRPITSLYPIDGLSSSENSLHIFFSLGHQQSMTCAMTPLSLSAIQVLMPIGRKENLFDNKYIHTNGGRLYADITLPLQHPILRKFALGLISQLDALAPEAVKQVIQQPEFVRSYKVGFDFSFLKWLLKIMHKVLRALWKRDLTGFVDRTNKLIDEYVAEVTQSWKSIPTGKKQIQAVLNSMVTFFPFFLNWVPEAGAGMAATRLLSRIAKRWLTPDEVEALTLGIRGNVVNEMNLAIGDLADQARRYPQVVDSFKHLGDDAHQWLRQTALLEGGPNFMAAWSEFLSRYGARGPSEIDIYMPRWYEDPLPLLRVVAEFLNGEEGRLRTHQRVLILSQEKTIQKLLKTAGRGPFAWFRIRLLKRLYHVMVEVGGMREHHKFLVIRLLAVIKEILKNNAEQLTAIKKISQPEDIWFLTWKEVFAIWEKDDVDWNKIITQRRIDLERYQKLSPPIIITSNGEVPVVQYHIENAPEGAILGNPVSPGVVEGVVHIINDPQRETLAPGEILVAEFTDPGWTPLFINAGAIILEVGGVLTHGAVVAREYGIPAIVGVRDAKTKLQNGQHVRVDGNRGIVELL